MGRDVIAVSLVPWVKCVRPETGELFPARLVPGISPGHGQVDAGISVRSGATSRNPRGHLRYTILEQRKIYSASIRVMPAQIHAAHG